jgi:hypothetical protein
MTFDYPQPSLRSSPRPQLSYHQIRVGERISEFRRRNGNISHSFAYKLADEGKIRIVKLGSKALVDVAYSQPYFDNLPEAKIKRDKRSKLSVEVTATANGAYQRTN